MHQRLTNLRINTFTNSEYAPWLDAEDVGHDLDGVGLEIDGTGLVGGKDGGTAVVGCVEGDVGGSVGDEELIEVLRVDGWDGDVLRVVEEIDGLVATGCPAVAEVIGLHRSQEAFGDVGLEVEHGRGEVVGHGVGVNQGINFLTCVSFAQNPFVDVAEYGFDEKVGVGDVEVGELVECQQDADDGARHAGEGVEQELAVGGREVVGARAGEGVVEMDVGVVLGDEPSDTHSGLPAL